MKIFQRIFCLLLYFLPWKIDYKKKLPSPKKWEDFWLTQQLLSTITPPKNCPNLFFFLKKMLNDMEKLSEKSIILSLITNPHTRNAPKTSFSQVKNPVLCVGALTNLWSKSYILGMISGGWIWIDNVHTLINKHMI